PARSASSSICATIAATGADQSTQINNAIASCFVGGVVMLQAGTYSLGSMIDFQKSGVTLRGAGPDKTIVRFASGAPQGCAGPNADVCFEGSFNWDGGPQNS